MHSPLTRWLILAAGILANLCQGVAYTSSIFMLPLGEVLQRPPELWASEWGLVFALTLAFLPLGMLISGKLADLGHTRLTTGIGVHFLQRKMRMPKFKYENPGKVQFRMV